MKALHDLLAYEIGDALDCTRVWEAWWIGTMGADDFVMVANRLDEIVENITLDLLTYKADIPATMTNEQSRRHAALVVARRNLALAIAEVMAAEARILT